jgi:DNA modification methylase
MLIKADARQLPLVDGCVDCIVTSPPYFGLRDYGNAAQIGLEATPDAYIEALALGVFRELRRVLKPAGVVWLNVGDSFASSAADRTQTGFNARYFGRPEWNPGKQTEAAETKPSREIPVGLKPKDLLGIPWRLAFALQADGWYLRSDVIWAKPNPMPESVTDRPTKSHEYLFLLAKSERYYYDQDAIREPYAESTIQDLDYVYTGVGLKDYESAGVQNPSDVRRRVVASLVKNGGANKRSVWTIPTKPYSGAHFATMPEALVEPCILAGCPLGGLVLDPFIGSGTVGSVAERLGRRWVGTDLSYQDLAKKRTAQTGLRFG